MTNKIKAPHLAWLLSPNVTFSRSLQDRSNKRLRHLKPDLGRFDVPKSKSVTSTLSSVAHCRRCYSKSQMCVLCSPPCTNAAQVARSCATFQCPTNALRWVTHLGTPFVEILAKTTNVGWDFTSVCAQNPAVLLFSLFPGSVGKGRKTAQLCWSSSLEMAVPEHVCILCPGLKESVRTGALVPFSPQGMQPTYEWLPGSGSEENASCSPILVT